MLSTNVNISHSTKVSANLTLHIYIIEKAVVICGFHPMLVLLCLKTICESSRQIESHRWEDDGIL